MPTVPYLEKNLKWFITVALAGGLNQAPYFFGFEGLGVGTGTLFFYSTMVSGGYLVGKIFFGEVITRTKYIALALAIIGMGVIYGFSLTQDQILPAFSMILGALMGATATILTKKISGNYSKTHIMTTLAVSAFASNLLLSRLLGESLPTLELSVPWLSLIGYSISYLVANATVIVGFRHLQASTGSLIGLAEILFGVSFGVWLFGEALPESTLLGGGLIILAAALLHLVKRRKKQLYSSGYSS